MLWWRGHIQRDKRGLERERDGAHSWREINYQATERAEEINVGSYLNVLVLQGHIEREKSGLERKRENVGSKLEENKLLGERKKERRK